MPLTTTVCNGEAGAVTVTPLITVVVNVLVTAGKGAIPLVPVAVLLDEKLVVEFCASAVSANKLLASTDLKNMVAERVCVSVGFSREVFVGGPPTSYTAKEQQALLPFEKRAAVLSRRPCRYRRLVGTR